MFKIKAIIPIYLFLVDLNPKNKNNRNGRVKYENAQTRTASVLKKTDYFAATPKIFGHRSQELADQALKNGKTLIIKITA